MRRSSRNRSHKERKHSSKDARDYSDVEDDVRMKERDTMEDEGSVRFSKELASGEKRKKDVKISAGIPFGDAGEEFVSSKRRKEMTNGSNSGGRWDGGGDDRGVSLSIDKELKAASSRLHSDKGSKSKESKVSGDSTSKSSRRVDASSEKKADTLNTIVEKDDNKRGGRVDSRKKSDKDYTRSESKDKERGSERERKLHDAKRDAETRAADGEVVRKQRSLVVDVGDGPLGKGGRENTEWSTQDDSRNPGLEQDVERRIQRRSDSYIDKNKFQDDARGSDERRLSSRSDQAKDGKHKDERHKGRSHGDQYREDGEKDGRHRDDKSRVDGEKDNRHKDVKYREDGEKYYRHKDDTNRDDANKDTKQRDNKYHEDGDRHHKYSAKYWDDDDMGHRQRDRIYLEDGDREKGHSNDRYHEDIKRDDRHREDKYREDGSRDNRYKDEKNEEVDRDSRHWDSSQGDDVDTEKRLRDTKYREEQSSRDRNNDKFNAKHVRDESNAADCYRKSSNRDDSPSYDKWSIRYKEDQGKRRAIDKEDHVKNRSRSTKEECADIEKRSAGSVKINGVPNRGRSSSRYVDIELNSSHGRHRDSPSSSSYSTRDHYRVSEQEDPRYRDYAYEEKAGHNTVSVGEYGGPSGANEKATSSRLVDSHIHKDDGYFGELSAEKRLNSDVRASPLRVVDKSPSSTSAERRRLNRSDVRRSLDVEDSGQRSGNYRDAKGGRGSRELPMDTVHIDEFSQGDGYNLSVSSPLPRGSHYSGNSSSCLPPPPFRIGADSQSVFGSSDDDSRGKSGSRHRRTGDPNMGRVHANSWKGVPNWTSPIANGFMPFQHGPPTVNFHQVMQQFPAPPIFGIRPPLDLNQTGVPYQMRDADRFSGHVRPLGWRNSVDDSYSLHPWESNNAVFGDESHPYVRLDWNHSSTLLDSQGRESSVEVWKGKNSVKNVDLPSTSQKEAHNAHALGNEMWTNQLGQQAQNEQEQSYHHGENVDISQLGDTSKRKTLEASKTTLGEAPNLSEVSKKGDANICHIYLSRLDISVDLALPELYEECKSLLNLNQNEISDDYDDESKILYVEGVVEAKTMIALKNSSTSLFDPISDSVYQRAISLYKKQREEFKVNGKNVPFSCLENLDFTPTSGHEGLGSSYGKGGELVPVCNCVEIEGTVSANHEKVEVPINIHIEEFSAIQHQKSDDVAGRMEKLEEMIPKMNMVKLVEGPISNEEKREHVVEEKQEHIVEEKLVPQEIAENSYDHLSHMVGEEKNMFGESGGNSSTSVNNGQKFLETKCGCKSSDMFSEACEGEGVIVESNESELVNLSRIHHSPENTH